MQHHYIFILPIFASKALWDMALELRFLLQNVFSSSTKLPQEPLRSSFCGSDEAVGEAYTDLIASSEKILN
ncbi:Aatf-like protein [Thalictrum thalictroides]|uniref:Aatf-like protein n=1 Tax=Thalictrum thalictroides TaxID=46969 RepID=A0A7J6VBQ8_THATH|nr:Aatf-like protein [Thalictrum thalictroides]